jgi:hypothetical protein
MNVIERCECCNKIIGIERDPKLGLLMFCPECIGDAYQFLIPITRKTDAYLLWEKGGKPEKCPVVAMVKTRDEAPTMLSFNSSGEMFNPTDMQQFIGYYVDGESPSDEDMVYANRRAESGVSLWPPKKD